MFNKYPYTDVHELNLDWIIAKICELKNDFDTFKAVKTISFRGMWDIRKNYPAWSIVDVDHNGYISLKPVPAGVDINNTEYWLLIANYSALFAEFQIRLANVESKVAELSTYVTPEMFGAVGDGVTDDTEAIQEAINNAKATKLFVVKFASKTYLCTDTINMAEGVILEGVNSIVWNNDNSTIIKSSANPVIKFDGATSSKLVNIAIQADTTNDGILVVNGSFNIAFDNIIVKTANNAFNIEGSWTYTFEKCRSENCSVGFRIHLGTSATFNSCVAFNGNVGFDLAGITYSVFNGCGTDGAKTGFKVTDCRGISMISCGVEGCDTNCFNFYGTNVDTTLTSPSIGNLATKDLNYFTFNNSINVTITGVTIPSAFVSDNSKVIDVPVDGGEKHITLVNPCIFKNAGDLSRCVVVGGNSYNYLPPTIVNRINSITGETGYLSSQTSSGVLANIEVNCTYLAISRVATSGGQGCYQIISTSGSIGQTNILDIATPTACTFEHDGAGGLKIKNTSSYSLNFRYTLLRLS